MILAYIYLAKSGSTVVMKGLVTDMNVIIGIMVAQYVVFTGLTLLIDTIKFRSFSGKKEVKKAPLLQPLNVDNNVPSFPGFFKFSHILTKIG